MIIQQKCSGTPQKLSGRTPVFLPAAVSTPFLCQYVSSGFLSSNLATSCGVGTEPRCFRWRRVRAPSLGKGREGREVQVRQMSWQPHTSPLTLYLREDPAKPGSISPRALKQQNGSRFCFARSMWLIDSLEYLWCDLVSTNYILSKCRKQSPSWFKV